MKIGLLSVRGGVLLLLFLILCIALPVLAEDKSAQESEAGEYKKMISPIALLKTCKPKEETKKADSNLGMKACSNDRGISSKGERDEMEGVVTTSKIPVTEYHEIFSGGKWSLSPIGSPPPDFNNFSTLTPHGKSTRP